ncbi:MAG: hypothetical protein ABI612_00435 [Betaproteobacteria bacterium]
MATPSTGSTWQDPATSSTDRIGSGTGSAAAVTQNAAATVDKIASGAHQAVDRIAAAANTAASSLGVKSEDMLAMKDQALDSARDYVREKPITALAIALAAGFLLSRIAR